jgi:hypothetical protein
MERELRPPRLGFFSPASLSNPSLRPQRAEKAPVFTTHALRLKARPVYFGGRLEVWLVILRRNLRRDFRVPCQILWVSCAVYFSSAKKALHGVHPTTLLRTPSSLARQTAPALRPQSPLALVRRQPDDGAPHVWCFRCHHHLPAFQRWSPKALSQR